MHRRSGFTIVELLIVIVVIAILAAISIVAYNGIQNRAKTVSGQTTAKEVQKKVQLYVVFEGSDETPDLAMLNARAETKFNSSAVAEVWDSGIGSAGLSQASTYNNGKRVIYAPDAGSACTFWWDYMTNTPRSILTYGTGNCDNWL